LVKGNVDCFNTYAVCNKKHSNKFQACCKLRG